MLRETGIPGKSGKERTAEMRKGECKHPFPKGGHWEDNTHTRERDAEVM